MPNKLIGKLLKLRKPYKLNLAFADAAEDFLGQIYHYFYLYPSTLQYSQNSYLKVNQPNKLEL